MFFHEFKFYFKEMSMLFYWSQEYHSRFYSINNKILFNSTNMMKIPFLRTSPFEEVLAVKKRKMIINAQCGRMGSWRNIL